MATNLPRMEQDGTALEIVEDARAIVLNLISEVGRDFHECCRVDQQLGLMIGAVQVFGALGHYCPSDNPGMVPEWFRLDSLAALEADLRDVLRSCAEYQRDAHTQYAEDAEVDGSDTAACYRFEVARAKRVLAVLDGNQPRPKLPTPQVGGSPSPGLSSPPKAGLGGSGRSGGSHLCLLS
jgi:hypothetical protein